MMIIPSVAPLGTVTKADTARPEKESASVAGLRH
jgi:hypothetical protein